MKRPLILAIPFLLALGAVSYGDGLLPNGCTGAACNSPASLTLNTPVLGNGTGQLISGTRTGNTTAYATATGTLTNGHCVSIDGSGNFVDAGGACSTGGGGGTVSSGTINQLGVYASTGTVISGLATANSGVLVTSGAGAPSVSTTLPNGLALSTPGSITLTNGTGLPIAGITGLGTGVGTALAAAVSGSGSICLTTNCVLVTPTLGVASATTINKVTLTAPATNAVLTIADGKTLTDTSAVGANLLLGATGGGFSAYAGVTCTNQFLRVLSSAGAGTCASVGDAFLSLSTPALGTPSSITLTNATGLPISGIAGLGTGVGTWLATPSSANLAAAVTDETGSGALVFGTAPTITLANGTGLPISTGVSGLGTGVATALASAVSGSGSICLTTSCTMVTPTLGAATATSVNGVTIPSATDTAALLGSAQTFTSVNTFLTGGVPAVFATSSASAALAFTRSSSTGNPGNGSNIGILTFGSYRTSDGTVFAPAEIAGQTTQAWTAGTAEGTRLVFATVPNSTTTPTLALTIDQDQTAKWSGTVPTVTGTGTPTIVSGSTDTAGEVTSGATATSVVITFSSAKANAPFCTVTPQTQLVAFSYTISTTAITITQTATSGEKIDYHCFQH